MIQVSLSFSREQHIILGTCLFVGQLSICELGTNAVIFVKVRSRHLIPFGVVFSHDRYDLPIRNVNLSAREKKCFVPTLLRWCFRGRLTTSENLPMTNIHSRDHSSSPSSWTCHGDLPYLVMKRYELDLRSGLGMVQRALRGG